jgi:hypothetical protein
MAGLSQISLPASVLSLVCCSSDFIPVLDKTWSVVNSNLTVGSVFRVTDGQICETVSIDVTSKVDPIE